MCVYVCLLNMLRRGEDMSIAFSLLLCGAYTGAGYKKF